MDSNRKRKGFIKGKLMPFYRTAPKSTSPAALPYSSSKVKQNSQFSSPTPTAAILIQQEDYKQISQPPKLKAVSFIVPATDANLDKLSQFDKLFGGTADEGVDTKATSYISSVRERFKLERSNSDRMMLSS